jgi:alpha-tubulin suppressor-like RCC1 family protein
MVCSWGRGEDGQLGHGDAEDRPVPTVLTAFDVPGISSVTCGADHTTAYSEDKMQLFSWGWYVRAPPTPPVAAFSSSSSFVRDD